MTPRILLPTVLLLLSPLATLAAECDFIPPAAQPDWVSGDRELAGHFVGVGVASRSAKGSDFQINKSQQDAIRDLSENIEVTIQSQLTIRQSTDGADGFSSEEAESLIVTSSDAVLKDVVTDAVWLDRSSCLVWTRVRIKRSIVELESNRQQQLVRITRLEQMLDSAGGAAASPETALEELELASSLLTYIDFEIIDAENRRSEFSLRIDQLGKRLATRSADKATAEELFLAAREQLRLAQTDTVNRKQHVNDALNSYRRVLTDFPFGGDGNLWSEKAAFEIATIELQRNNPCAAHEQLNQIKESSRDNQSVLKARKQMRKARCGEQERMAYNFRKLFDAKTVAVDCSYSLANTREWDNVCDKIISHFNSNGAVASRHPANSGAPAADFAVRVFSAGNLKTRDSSGSTEYQFQGDISTRISSDMQLLMEDNYSGVGGWNPVSEKMAMEVLGIHVYRRFVDRLNKTLGG